MAQSKGSKGSGGGAKTSVQAGNTSSTGAQGNPPASHPVTGTPNPQRTGAGQGRVVRGQGPATP